MTLLAISPEWARGQGAACGDGQGPWRLRGGEEEEGKEEMAGTDESKQKEREGEKERRNEREGAVCVTEAA